MIFPLKTKLSRLFVKILSISVADSRWSRVGLSMIGSMELLCSESRKLCVLYVQVFT